MRGRSGDCDARPADTIAAIATPPGRSGVGVVRVSGSKVPAIIAGIVHRALAPRHATLATFCGAHGEAIDQGIAVFFPSPHSYTGEDVLELDGHGGPAVLALMLGRCVELGARLARPGEFTQRAFLEGKLDLAQAEAVADLIDAATATAARAAARSLTGAFSNEIRALVDELIELRMFTEAALDFPDEDVAFLRAADIGERIDAIAARLARILDKAEQGSLLREGLTVAVIGRPNVGKSSLMNQLAGEQVAIVTPFAGTTRDALRAQIAVDGIPLTVIDTAGLRQTTDPIETIGIERTRSVVKNADLALVLIDSSTSDHHDVEQAIAEEIPEATTRLVVHNKIDLSGLSARVEKRSRHDAKRAQAPLDRHVFLSAKTGEGVDLLRREILEVAGAHQDMEGVFLARERHLIALRAAGGALESAKRHIDLELPPLELLAEDLRAAHDSLAEITGEFSSDDLLGVIFSRFCIGK